MATIQIHRKHTQGKEATRAAVERLAVDLRSRLQVTYRWEGDTLYFERSGADGRIDIGDHDLDIRIELGFPLSAMKGMVETQVKNYLDQNIR
jgi:putative polyhydroxyalkanoate system protein